MIEFPIEEKLTDTHDKREALAYLYYNRCLALAANYERDHPEDTGMQGFTNSLSAVKHTLFEALGTFCNWKGSRYNLFERVKENSRSPENTCLAFDFVRWYDETHPYNGKSSRELYDIIVPHIPEYWSESNSTDDCYTFFRKVMDRHEESC